MIGTIAKGTCDEQFESMAVQLDGGGRSVVLRRRWAGARLLWGRDADDRPARDSHAGPDSRGSARANEAPTLAPTLASTVPPNQHPR